MQYVFGKDRVFVAFLLIYQIVDLSKCMNLSAIALILTLSNGTHIFLTKHFWTSSFLNGNRFFLLEGMCCNTQDINTETWHVMVH